MGCTSNFEKRPLACQYLGFRIPGLVNAGNGTLLAFCEGRKYTRGDFGVRRGLGQHDMVMRRSTTSGKTWGNLTTILDALDFEPWKALDAESRPDTGNAVWDPTPLYDAHRGRVWVFFGGPGFLAGGFRRLSDSLVTTRSVSPSRVIRRAR